MLKSRILMAVALTAAVLLAVYYPDTYVSFTALYCLILLFAVAAISVLISPFVIKTDRSVSKTRVVKNETLNLTAAVRNSGALPFFQVRAVNSGLELANAADSGDRPFTLTARSARKQSQEISFPYRGVYELGALEISLADFLGLFRRSYQTAKEDGCQVVVYPDAEYALTIPLIRSSEYQNAVSYGFVDPDMDERDMRKYMPEDDLRKIHWKLSAKRGELIIREYETAKRARTPIVLDTRALTVAGIDKAALEDKMTTYAASAMRFCGLRQIPAELVYGGSPKERVRVEPGENLNALLEVLACLPFDGASPLEAALANLERESGPRDVVVLLAAADGSVTEALRRLAVCGHNVVVYYFESAALTVDRAALDEIRLHGVTVEMVTVEHAGDNYES